LTRFISIGTNDKLNTSTDEILDAIARLERLHSKCASQLNDLVQRREDVPPVSPRRATVPSIGLTAPNGAGHLLASDDEGGVADDISVMQGALSAAWDLISTYDPSGQSVIDRTPVLELDDADSGLGSEDYPLEEIEPPVQITLASRRRSSARQLPSQQVKHIHATSRRVLDGCIAKYQLRVQNALKKDQVHTAEADLQQLMSYAEERKDKYNVDFDKIQMREQLAEIYKRQGKHMEVFGVLRQLLPTADSTDDHTLEHSRHYQLIAETYYQLWTSKDGKADLVEAQNYALTAFTIREDLDAEEGLLKETADLLAEIYEALNSPVEAEVYRDMFAHVEAPPLSPELRQTVERPASVASQSIAASRSLEENMDVNKELLRAIKDRDVTKVRKLLQSEDINLDYRTKQYQTPLHYAFQRSQGNESMPLALLEHGFAIDADDEDGRTVLHQAAARADARMIRLAIHRDAIKEAKDKTWLTPLLIAVKEGHRHRECKPVIDAIEALLDEGCDPKARDQDGWTILHHAAHNSASLGSTSKGSAIANNILELLLRKLPQTSLESKDKTGYTPLLKVASSGDPITVGMLLDAGADVTARNGAGRSALYLAMYKKPDIPKYANVIKLLADRGAPIDEDEYAKEDYKKFKHLLIKPDNASMRRLSGQTRRYSEGKNSIHQVERTSTSGNSSLMSQPIPEDGSAVDVRKGKKSSGLKGIFGRK
jgi:ankyrin repeat protein